MRGSHLDDPATGDFPGERVFGSEVRLRYVLHEGPRDSDLLVVGFSAAQSPHRPARFHGHKLMRGFRCHRLFVLDDHGPAGPHPGPSWYLGSHPRFAVANAVCALVERTRDELGVDRGRVVTVGSSMGGWAALYFAARLALGHAIASEPQSRLGSYLCVEWFSDLAEHLVGGIGEAERDRLDALLFDALRASAAPPAVRLYCGRGSPYLEEHVRPLIGLLCELGITWVLELGDHDEHEDVKAHYPGYVARQLAELLADPISPGAGGRFAPLRRPSPAPS